MGEKWHITGGGDEWGGSFRNAVATFIAPIQGRFHAICPERIPAHITDLRRDRNPHFSRSLESPRISSVQVEACDGISSSEQSLPTLFLKQFELLYPPEMLLCKAFPLTILSFCRRKVLNAGSGACR